MRYRSSTRTRRGVSLVITLLCITVLTIIVMAFMQSMSLERKTAASYSNIARAQLAAESAQNEAVSRLSTLMSTLPYHAIGYTNATVNGVSQLYTILFGASNAAATPTPYYLLSSTNTNAAISALGSLPSTLDITNTTAMNRRTADGSTNDPGWMGSPVSINGTIQYREARAPWVYILQDPTKPYQPNRANADYNPRVARYAWWIEDETSKLDITVAGNNEGTSGAFRQIGSTNIVDPTNSFKDAQITKASGMDLGAIPIINGLPIATNSPSTNNQLITFRANASKFPRDARFLAQAPGFSASEAKARFYLTQSGIANDLAGNGRRRVNLNAIVTEGVTSSNTIASDLDDIAYAITGKHLYPGLNNSADKGFFHNIADNPGAAILPNFGERFWPSTDGRFATPGGFTSARKRQIYMTKVAANIRDYIDSDSMPTFVDRDGKIVAGRDPGLSPGAPPADGPTYAFPTTAEDGSRNNLAQPMAIGKEAIPYLAKHAWVFRSGPTFNTSTGTDITFDQFFTFFNPSTKDFVAPVGTFLRSYKRMRWQLSTGIGLGNWQMQAFEVNLSGVTFPAGMATVLTTSPGSSTDPTGAAYSAIVGGPGGLWRLTSTIRHSPNNPTEISGSAEAQEGTRKYTGARTSLSAYLIANRGYGGGGNHDWHTHMVWGTPNGYLGGYSAITMTQTGTYRLTAANQVVSTATSMRGNDAPSHSGDARSLEEPLALNDAYLSGSQNADQDQYRFYSSSSNPPLASARNDQYLVPPGDTDNFAWPDYNPFFNDNAITAKETAYAVIRDQPMTSIAELGNIYDPYRRNGNNVAADNNTGYIDYARGGARTFKIGQPDDVIVNGTGRPTDVNASVAAPRFTAEWQNAAWRLTDIFDVMLDSSAMTQTVNTNNINAPSQSVGKININSVLRDDGAVLRSLLRRFEFLPATPHTDGGLAGKKLSTNEIDGSPYGNTNNGLIPQIKRYLALRGPMMERGELSQIGFFATNVAGGKSMTNTMDRGREEIFRRILPMLTTRSSAFSIHAIGQAVKEDNSGKITPLSEALKANVYRFDPKIGTSPLDSVTSYSAESLYEKF